MPPQKTWFFEKDGKPFAVNEKEAWTLLTNKSNWRRQDIKMLGMSDGETFHKVIKEAGPRKEELKTQIAEIKKKLNKYIAGHDRLMFEEFAEEDDPRVVRAKELIKKTEDELDPVEAELDALQLGLYEKAFNAELEKARGNMVSPRNFTVIAPKGASNPQHKAMLDDFKRSKGA